MAKGIKLRNWSLDINDYETDDQFRAAVELELARFEHIGERFGIALIAAPVKERIQDERTGRVWYETRGWTFQTATIPAARETTPEPEVELPPVDEDPAEEAVPAVATSDDPYATEE